MRSYAKLNVFLKITGFRGNYHEISSRFILFENLFDEIEFVKTSENDKFEIDANINIQDNIIKKTYEKLCLCGYKNKLDEFFKFHKVKLIKNIPMGSGLGGGSSNAATFLRLANKEINLGICDESLMQIGSQIGADVTFFISGFKSANVSGIGENIKEFIDEIPNLEVFTPNLFCSTKDVYEKFRSDFSGKFDINLAKNLENLSSKKILQIYKNTQLNDLLEPCKKLYSLSLKENEFLSGSGSSYFLVS